MQIKAFIILFSLSGLACSNDQKINQQTKKDIISLKNDPVIGKFTLPYGENLSTDTSSFIFYYDKPFDTSFLVHIRNLNDEMVGTYHETIPKYHRDLEGYSEDGIKFLLFDGFSFAIGEKVWDSIRNSAKELLDRSNPDSLNVCFDCASCYLAYNTRMSYTNKGNRIYFEQLRKLLKTLIIDKINNVRKNRFD